MLINASKERKVNRENFDFSNIFLLNFCMLIVLFVNSEILNYLYF